MKVTLNIQDDQELRASIKNAIRGQVLSIVREELTQTIKDEFKRKLMTMDTRLFDRMLAEALAKVVEDILHKEFKVSRWNGEFIKPIIEAAVNNAIAGKNWSRMVDDLAKQKIKALISQDEK